MSARANGSASGNGVEGLSVSDSAKGRKPAVDKAADFANYFCTYAFLYHQKEMLSDRVRMEAYYNAIMRNPRHYKDKVVLDVGTGSGILALWAAMAGARKVYAVEATNMAQHARTLIHSNGFGDVIEVIQSSVEDAALPEKVDIIVSEWMGYFLVRESMFDSVIIARDRWLKPDGKMYPSHARMWLAPIKTGLGDHKAEEFQHSMADWSSFMRNTQSRFQVDMSALTGAFEEEQRKYFLQTSLWNNLYPHQVLGHPAAILEMDCKTARLEDIEQIRSNFSMPLYPGEGRVSGICGWFDVQFRGSEEDPAEFPVELSTAPNAESTTHWGQQVFILSPPMQYGEGDSVQGSIEITRSTRNHRLMDVKLVHSLSNRRGTRTKPVTSTFFIE